MSGFLRQVAADLYKRYGDEISSLNIIFPSRRARLFFNDALSTEVGRPVWQPVYRSIDEIAEEVSGIAVGDRIRLITELYKVYSRHHDETFDSFYFWGEILLADFDSIDKYLIDADMLFANIADLKAIEDNFDFLTPDQRVVIARFWRSFGEEAAYSDEQQRFMSIWNTLRDIYHDYRRSLTMAGLAYSGMVYRQAAERIKNGEVAAGERKKYVIAGFNALSESEKALFDHLAKAHDTEFFWDYDHYYLDNPDQEAGIFLRENMVRFPQTAILPYTYDGFTAEKNITVVSAPSDSLQCKYVSDFLRDAQLDGRSAGKNTAIVLTDENLLIPALHSIPNDVGTINVTMGYPLKLTLAYSFVERLITLQSRKRERDGRVLFYHEDVKGMLNHPYMVANDAETQPETADIQQIYVDVSHFAKTPLAESVFTSVDDHRWESLADYLRQIIGRAVASHTLSATSLSDADKAEYRQRLEFFSIILENLDKLQNSLNGCGIELSNRIFASLLRRVLQSVQIPYEGEPLQGVQVMGILETRNIDFENVLLLSVNDDTFPGNRSSSPSFIPYNLRFAYGLPTPQHHEGVYAYYFYRLLQRANNVHIVYSSRSDEKSSGEQSRYIYQLEYESQHTINRREISVNVNVAPCERITVTKDAAVMAILGQFCQKNGRKLFPTSFFNYLQCPLKFYFHSVSRLRPEEEVAEEIEAAMFGNILHRAMELLYTPLVGTDLSTCAKDLLGTSHIEFAVDKAIMKEYFQDADVTPEDYSGNLLLVKDIIIKYINTCILPFDADLQDITVEELEKEIDTEFGFETVAGDRCEIRFGGVSDRVDRLPDGTLRIVDYKTGAENLGFKDIASLFSPVPAHRNAAALQTLIYAMMFNHRTGCDIQPALYYVRTMNRSGYSPLIENKAVGAPIVSYIRCKDEFESHLRDILREIFDPSIPFTQCEDPKPCHQCDFNEICKRG